MPCRGRAAPQRTHAAGLRLRCMRPHAGQKRTAYKYPSSTEQIASSSATRNPSVLRANTP